LEPVSGHASWESWIQTGQDDSHVSILSTGGRMPAPGEASLRTFAAAADEIYQIVGNATSDRAHRAFENEDHEWLSLVVLDGLVKKAREDTAALTDMILGGKTGPAFALMRSLLDDAVDLVYATPRESTERVKRAVRFILYGYFEDRRVELLVRREHVLRKKGRCLQLNDTDLALPAARSLLNSVRAEGRTELEAAVKDAVDHLRSCRPPGQKAQTLQRLWKPGNREKLRIIGTDGNASDKTYDNLVFVFRVLYPLASGFVHTTGAIYFLGSRPRVQNHSSTPATLISLLVPDMLDRCGQLLELGVPDSLVLLAEKASEFRAACKPT